MWFDDLKEYIQRQTEWMVHTDTPHEGYLQEGERESFLRKKLMLEERKANIVNNNVQARVLREQTIEKTKQIDYLVHYSYLIRQGFDFYIEEQLQERRATFIDDVMVSDEMITPEGKPSETVKIDREIDPAFNRKFEYNRLEAVKYAERWWNTFNPAYKAFDVDCTNYISQCLYAGGIPMTDHTIRTKGWWFRQNNWSFSWTVANAFRWHLSGSRSGLRAQEVSSAHQLMPGDVICYDFEGNGRWDHTTIVVGKDSVGEPLVNAHTTNSRMRYWGYEDSTAYTENIKYKFFRIVSSS
ncbi:amidase domain-containing protein [Fictibacillus sp. Mic-4]|uniref:amidase domain-containing protein n=1 Tax=Fictibacillus sp. Mic-4 TaxID=3132826 RepID=UPI003CF2D835